MIGRWLYDIRYCWGERMIDRAPNFREEIQSVINRFSRENVSDTPDFILAEFLMDSLLSFDKAVAARTKWYGHEDWKDDVVHAKADGGKE